MARARGFLEARCGAFLLSFSSAQFFWTRKGLRRFGGRKWAPGAISPQHPSHTETRRRGSLRPRRGATAPWRDRGLRDRGAPESQTALKS